MNNNNIKLIGLLLILFFSSRAESANYYWVGGTGNWSDLNHWRTTSGGDSIPTTVPSSTDDVFLDANSGNNAEITFDVTANCRNITVKDCPGILSLSYGVLNIYGSSVWQSGMGIVGTINYQNTGVPKTITSNGAKMYRVNLYETSSITLQDDFNAQSDVTLYAGTFDTNGKTLTFDWSANFVTVGTASKILKLRNSIINIGGYFKTTGSNTTVDAGTSHIYCNNHHCNIEGLAGQDYYNVTIMGGYIKGGMNFHNVEFKNRGSIGGNHTFNQLVLAPNFDFDFYGGLQIINTLFQFKNSPKTICSSNSNIMPTLGGSGTINMGNSATVEIENARIQNIKITGGISRIAQQSLDAGGNSGFTFIAPIINSTPANIDLYWVGGSGNWDDPEHWSLTSGGTGGICPPTPSNNVFIDTNSTPTDEGYYHSINILNNIVATCKDITGKKSISINASPYSSLDIYGSSEWATGTSYGVTTTNYRDTGKPKTIKNNGTIWRSSSIDSPVINLYESSSISLEDDLISIESTEPSNDISGAIINQYAGTFNTNNHNLKIQGFQTLGTANKTVNLGSSIIDIQSHDTSYFDTSGENTILNSNQSNININSYKGFIKGLVGHEFYNASLTTPSTNSTSSLNKILGEANFHKVEFNFHGAIEGTHTFDELILAKGATYTIESGKTQTINSLLEFNSPPCSLSNLGTLSADNISTPAIIKMPTGATIGVSGVNMSGITAAGGANFIASGSINGGNNSGWTFATPFVASASRNLYWVGGAGSWVDMAHWATVSGGTGGNCIPTSIDDVFIDAGSGLTDMSKDITFPYDSSNSAVCHNITVSGSPTAPQLGNFRLNIYGSSVWQNGMVTPYYINYMNTGQPKTITSNGAQMGKVFIYETNTMTLQDDFSATEGFYLKAGTFDTNNRMMTLQGDFRAGEGRSASSHPPVKLKLGSSTINIKSELFDTSDPYVTVEAGTSHINITGHLSIFTGAPGQQFYNVTFNPAYPSVSNDNSIEGNGMIFNQVIFNTVGRINPYSNGGNNTFSSLVFNKNGTVNDSNTFAQLTLGEGTYQFGSGKTQTITGALNLSGTPCSLTQIQSTIPGTQAILDIKSGATSYNFATVKDINSTRLLSFGNYSENLGNNTNMTFVGYNPGVLTEALLEQNCTVFTTDTSTYTLDASTYDNHMNTTYQWTKPNDTTYTGVLGTGSTLDVRNFGGYGTYHLKVSYGASGNCVINRDLKVNEPNTEKPAVSSDKVCQKHRTTLADIAVTVTGSNLKWYASETALSSAALPSSTIVHNGETYYVSKTVNGCEGPREKVIVTLTPDVCNKVIVNPGIPLWIE